MDEPVCETIETTRGLERLAETLATRRRFAVDTEANGFHAWRPRLCLIQLAWEVDGGETRVALVDPLAAGLRLGALAGPLADPGIEKVLHGADYDVRLLARDADLEISGLFDTDIAARMLGWKRTSLAALAEEIAGRKLPKAAQRLDWARRPLPRSALRYAADDVRLLLPIRDRLAAELDRTGRRGWAAGAFGEVEKVRSASEPEEPDPDALLARAKGAGRLSPAQRACLAEALVWRERLAARRDRPAAFIVSTPHLVEAVRRDARSPADLVAAGMPGRTVERHGRQILAALDRGRRLPPRPLPRARGEGPLTAEAADALARLRRARAGAASELGIDPGFLCPTGLLREIARRPAGARRDLKAAGLADWQIEALGARLLAALPAES